jgi:hypothetical protein
MINLNSCIEECSKYYRVIKPFFDIDPKLIDQERSSLIFDEDYLKLKLFSIGDVCCPIEYEIYVKPNQRIFEIIFVIDGWEGIFDTEFDIDSDFYFIDEGYIRSVLQNEIVVENYYPINSKKLVQSKIIYYENLGGSDTIRRVRLGNIGLVIWICRKRYRKEVFNYAPWIGSGGSG